MAEEMQRKALEFQILREELEAYQGEAVKLIEQETELRTTKNAVQQLQKLKKGTEIKVPLGSGIYVDAKLGDVKALVAGVGGELFLEKEPKEALELLEGRIGKVDDETTRMAAQMQVISNALQQLKKEIEENAGKE